jgi:hypothetical protein
MLTIGKIKHNITYIYIMAGDICKQKFVVRREEKVIPGPRIVISTNLCTIGIITYEGDCGV